MKRVREGSKGEKSLPGEEPWRPSQREYTIRFLEDSEIKFLGPARKFGSDYWRGSSLVVSDILSGGPTTIRVRCLDGEVGVLQTHAIRIE